MVNFASVVVANGLRATGAKVGTGCLLAFVEFDTSPFMPLYINKHIH